MVRSYYSRISRVVMVGQVPSPLMDMADAGVEVDVVQCTMSVSKHELSSYENKPRVTLRAVTRANWRAALALVVEPDQLRFLSDSPHPVALALAKAYIQPGDLPVAPFGVYSGDEMVGFLALAYEPDSADRYLIMHFLVDRRHQRRGFGTAALHALVALLHERHPACTSVSLTVHPDNHPAQHFYKRFGFEDTGILLFGEPCYRLPLDIGARDHRAS